MPGDTRPGVFERHLAEAIALNRARAPIYAAASSGASTPVSNFLIRSELALLPVARWFDRADAPYGRAGVPLFASLFEPMPSGAVVVSRGAAHGTRDRVLARPAGVASPSAWRVWRRIARGERSGAFAGATRTLQQELEALAPYPATDCMLRHMLESARRIATMAPVLGRRCIASGQPDPGRMLRRLFTLHLWGLPAAARLDRIALPIQRSGIPILEQDLPHIPASAAAGQGSSS